MIRRLVLLLFLALAMIGLDRVAAGVVGPEAHEFACCDRDDACGIEDCSGPDGCGCAPHLVAVPAPRVPAPEPTRFVLARKWASAAAQHARDRRTAPPTRPPIG